MKLFKTITIFPDGSYFFSLTNETLITNKLIFFKKQKNKNSNLYEKKNLNKIKFKQSSVKIKQIKNIYNFFWNIAKRQGDRF